MSAEKKLRHSPAIFLPKHLSNRCSMSLISAMSVKVGDEGRVLFHVIVSIANNKGGTGKTTTAVNLGTALAQSGRRVLLVDLDPQGSATVSFGFDKAKLLYTVYDVLAQSRKMESLVLDTKFENLSLVPSN